MGENLEDSGEYAEEILEEALEVCEHSKARYHIRQALQYLATEEAEGDGK